MDLVIFLHCDLVELEIQVGVIRDFIVTVSISYVFKNSISKNSFEINNMIHAFPTRLTVCMMYAFSLSNSNYFTSAKKWNSHHQFS